MPPDGQSEPLPRLRRVDIVPLPHGRETMFAIRDPSGLTPQHVVVSPVALLVLQMLDGKHTMRQVQTELVRRTGQLVRSDQIERMIGQFDEHLLLETAGFEAHRLARLEEYRASGLRPCTHAEGGYPAEPEPFSEMVREWMAALPPRARPAQGRMVGAIAPHIDFARGAAGYAHVYRDLAEGCDADLFIILGTDHFGDAQFAATRSDFETPLGRVATAREVVDRIAEGFIGDLLDGELQHLGEHTIEFQAVLLQHFVGPRRPFQIVPLLCGGFGEEIGEGLPAADNTEVRSLVECLQQVLADAARKACVIASADLSHVGPQFGGTRALTPAYLEKVAEVDQQALACALAGDGDGMYGLVAARMNETNICGLAPIYVAVQALGPCRGELLEYGQATSPDRRQSVSFAAASLWR